MHDFCDFVKVETRQNGAHYRIPLTFLAFKKFRNCSFALLTEAKGKKFRVFWSNFQGDCIKKIQNLHGTFVADFCGGGVRFLAIWLPEWSSVRISQSFLGEIGETPPPAQRWTLSTRSVTVSEPILMILDILKSSWFEVFSTNIFLGVTLLQVGCYCRWSWRHGLFSHAQKSDAGGMQ